MRKPTKTVRNKRLIDEAIYRTQIEAFNPKQFFPSDHRRIGDNINWDTLKIEAQNRLAVLQSIRNRL